MVGYTDDRAKKDAYNREKGIRRLKKAYKHGALTKGNINKRGYNKFLSMNGEVKVTINYDRIVDDSKWDGLKGFLTNTDIPIQDVYTAYHNLWHVKRAFRIAKSKIEIRPMFHFTRKRIEAHICICFVALKVYKELEHMYIEIFRQNCHFYSAKILIYTLRTALLGDNHVQFYT